MENSKALKATYGELTLVSLMGQLINCSNLRDLENLRTELYDRLASIFYDRLFKVAAKRFSGVADWESKVDEVHLDTFETFFEKVNDFKLGEDWDDEECQKVVLFWMAETANRKFLFLARRSAQDKKDFNEYKWDRKHDPHDGQYLERKYMNLTYDKSKFDAFWKKLSPMSQDILMACVEYGTIQNKSSKFISNDEVGILKLKNDIDSCALPTELRKKVKHDTFVDRNTDHLPDEVIEYLTKTYNVKSPAIRKAKQRALEGLEKCKI